MTLNLSDLRPRTITQKILTSLLFISSIVTLLITCLQLYIDYSQEISTLRKSLSLIEKSYAQSLSASVWELNDGQIITQLDGITSIPGIGHAVIDYRGKHIYISGKPVENYIEKSIDLIHHQKGQDDVYLGTLILHGSKDDVMDKIKNKILLIFVTQFIKTFLVSVFLFICIQHLLTKHLIHIASFVKNMDIRSREKLMLNRGDQFFSTDDELESLVKSINEMRDNLYLSYKELEELNSEQRKQLEFSARMSSLGEMAAGIAHEINNPLTIIGTSSKLIRRNIEAGNRSPEKVTSYFEKIEKTTERITKIINGMLAISRDASNEDLKDTSWNEIIHDVVTLCGEKFNHAGIQITIKDSPSLNTIFKGRKVQLSQVLLNLLHNSYDAIVELIDKWIEIDCTEEKGELIVRITDSGPGIPVEIQDKVMQPFFTTKEAGKGTGLGLSLSMAIIKKHNGQFYIDKNVQNTCFVIRIPKS
jgi:signal transduction histidine kinase